MNFHKTLLILLLALSVLASGCSNSQEAEATLGPSMPLIENIFTTPAAETEPQEAAPSFQNVTGITSYELPEYSLDDVGHYVVYEGGEMHLPYAFTYSGSALSQYGVAIMLFLDGRMQPFRTSDDDSLQYVHMIYPEASMTDSTVTLDLMFTPVTGQSGDVMDLSILSKQFADWEWDNESVGLNGNTSSITTRLKFAQTPPEAELPEMESRILDWSCSYTDATLAEYEAWSEDSWNKLSTCIRIHGEGYGSDPASNRYLYDVTADVPMELTMEMVNTSGVEYGVVIFIDNEPVSTDPADIIYVDEAPGQRAVLSLTLDMSGFDGQSKVYAVIIPRNYLATIGYTSEQVVDVVDTVEYYLFAESSWAEVMGQ